MKINVVRIHTRLRRILNSRFALEHRHGPTPYYLATFLCDTMLNRFIPVRSSSGVQSTHSQKRSLQHQRTGTLLHTRNLLALESSMASRCNDQLWLYRDAFQYMFCCDHVMYCVDLPKTSHCSACGKYVMYVLDASGWCSSQSWYAWKSKMASFVVTSELCL